MIVEIITQKIYDAKIDFAGILIDEHNLASSNMLELRRIIEGVFLKGSKCATKVIEKRYLLSLL
jgi:hypothetical protein